MDGFKELYYAIDTDELKIVWEGERGEEPFARLSDGQRNIIAMIGVDELEENELSEQDSRMGIESPQQPRPVERVCRLAKDVHQA